jgi:hypothetical protein
MREERVTINILSWLEAQGWTIICYDFPQSGRGILIHPNSLGGTRSKNQGAIIPDIIAVKGNQAVFFENKDRFVLSDFVKLRMIATSGVFSDGLDSILKNHPIEKIFFGVGIPSVEKEVVKALENISGIDFLVSTDLEKNVYVNHDAQDIFKLTSLNP